MPTACPLNRLRDYSLRLMRWMNHYLKGEGGNPPPHELDYGPVE